jgi:hypothetical protein
MKYILQKRMYVFVSLLRYEVVMYTLVNSHTMPLLHYQLFFASPQSWPFYLFSKSPIILNKHPGPKRIIGKNGGPRRRRGTRGHWPLPAQKSCIEHYFSGKFCCSRFCRGCTGTTRHGSLQMPSGLANTILPQTVTDCRTRWINR